MDTRNTERRLLPLLALEFNYHGSKMCDKILQKGSRNGKGRITGARIGWAERKGCMLLLPLYSNRPITFFMHPSYRVLNLSLSIGCIKVNLENFSPDKSKSRRLILELGKRRTHDATWLLDMKIQTEHIIRCQTLHHHNHKCPSVWLVRIQFTSSTLYSYQW